MRSYNSRWGRVGKAGFQVEEAKKGEAVVPQYRAIRWDKVSEEAKRRGLVAAKKLLVKRNSFATVPSVPAIALAPS
jgi:hypothetical protein